MSTNALVVVPTAAAWSGTYVHWDGYQLHKQLVPMVKRDGLAQVIMTLFKHTWSSLDYETPTQEEIDAAKPDQSRKTVAGYHRWLQDNKLESPGNMVPGFGIFNGDFEESTPQSYLGYPEWVYVLAQTQLQIYEGIPYDIGISRIRRTIKWDDPNPDLSDLEGS